MQFNIGTPERVIRLVLGTVLVILPFVIGFSTLWTWVSISVGAVLIVTGLLRFCPIWAMFGIRSGSKR